MTHEELQRSNAERAGRLAQQGAFLEPWQQIQLRLDIFTDFVLERLSLALGHNADDEERFRVDFELAFEEALAATIDGLEVQQRISTLRLS